MGNTSSGRSWPRDVRDLFRGGNSRSSRRRGDGGHNDCHHGAPGTDDRPVSAADTGRGGTTQRGVGGRTNYSKLNSCPDLQVVARSGIPDQQRRQRNDVDQPPIKLNVKIYRSYRFRSTAVVLKEHLLHREIHAYPLVAAIIVFILKLRLLMAILILMFGDSLVRCLRVCVQIKRFCELTGLFLFFVELNFKFISQY